MGNYKLHVFQLKNGKVGAARREMPAQRENFGSSIAIEEFIEKERKVECTREGKTKGREAREGEECNLKRLRGAEKYLLRTKQFPSRGKIFTLH